MLTLFAHKNPIAGERGRNSASLRWLSNSKSASEETTVTTQGVDLANDTQGKPVPEWIEIPFGNWDHRVGMQVFDQSSAEAIIANFKSLGARSKGIPFYEGHPDVNPERWPDKSAKGWIKEMTLSDSGLRLKVAWNSAGQDLVAHEKYAYFSPTWGCLPVSNRSGQFRPIRLRSVGLVNEPNIVVMPLTNETQPKGHTMPPWLLELLGLAPDATEEAAQTALATRLKAAADAALANETALGACSALGLILLNEAPADGDAAQDRADFIAWMHELLGTDPATGVDGLKTALQDKVEKAGHVERVKKARGIVDLAQRNHMDAYRQLESAMSNEKAERTTAETELANARTALAAERQARAGLVVANLIGAGKLRKADADAKLTELANAGDGFDTLAATLSNAASVLPVGGSLTTHLSHRKAASEQSAQVLDLVNERMAKNHEDYRTAFNQVKKENPALFDAMKQPATATK